MQPVPVVLFFLLQAQPLAEHEAARLSRKCKSLYTAYSKCMHVNKDDAKACANLEVALVSCWGEQGAATWY